MAIRTCLPHLLRRAALRPILIREQPAVIGRSAMSKQKFDYGAAMEGLYAQHNAGTISDAIFELQKARLLASATQEPRTLGVKFLVVAGCIFSVLMLLSLLGVILGGGVSSLY